MKVDRSTVIQIAIWVFAAGGAYFMLKSHDTRITKLEDKSEKYALKEDVKESTKALWEALRRRGQ